VILFGNRVLEKGELNVRFLGTCCWREERKNVKVLGKVCWREERAECEGVWEQVAGVRIGQILTLF